MRHGDVAQLGERCLRKAEAEGSNPFISTIFFLPFYPILPAETQIIIRKKYAGYEFEESTTIRNLRIVQIEGAR